MSDDIFERLVSKVKNAAEVLADRYVKYAQDQLSTRYPPSGPEYTGPPARRRGWLRDGMHSAVEREGNTVVMTIMSDRVGVNPNVPRMLEQLPTDTEFGAMGFKPRPYMRPLRDNRIRPNLPRELVELLR